MSDLERARAHLLNRQADLVEARIWKNSHSPQLGMTGYENNFFAALSWVWDEQEKAKQLRENVLVYVATRNDGWKALVLRDA